MKVNNTLLGVVGAAALGAALGILFAPKKGSETRRDIADGTKELKNSVKTNVDSVLNEVSDTVKTNVDTVLNEVSQKFNAIKEDGKELVAKGKEKINKATQEA